MSEPIDRNVSFRALIKGELDDFLSDEGWTCAETSSALVALVAGLAGYREEGVSLSPEVLVCQQVSKLSQMLHRSEVIRIGDGPRTEQTIVKVLKECAPLAQGGWSIFVERTSTTFNYGVFSATRLPLAVTPHEAIMEEPPSDALAIFVRNVGHNCVEVRGCRGNRRCLHFSAARPESPSPETAIDQLAESFTFDVPKEIQESTFRFCYRALTESLRKSHGALIAVLPKREPALPCEIEDAIVFERPIDLAARVSEFDKLRDNESMSKLQTTEELLAGMIASDGIVVFRSDASIIGYRAFLRPYGSIDSIPTGGARRRTFEHLRLLIEGKQIAAAFMRSQDGEHCFYRT